DCKASSLLGRLKVDDRAALDPVRALMADAEHLASVGSAAQRARRLHRAQPCDEANNFRGADVKNRQDRALACGNLAHARRERPEAHGCGPFFGAWASAHSAAASCDSRANTRPGVRRS